jgi:hypothetical protein
MARHPPLPDPEEKEGIMKKEVATVKETVPQASTDDDADHAGDEGEIIGLLKSQSQPSPLDLVSQSIIKREKPEHIGETIVPDSKLPMEPDQKGTQIMGIIRKHGRSLERKIGTGNQKKTISPTTVQNGA